MATCDSSQVALVVKNPPADAGDIRDVGSIPGLGRSPGGGYHNLFQYSCLENPMERGDWQAMAHSVAKSQTRLKGLSMHAHVLGLFAYCSLCPGHSSSEMP